jgi:protein gp37
VAYTSKIEWTEATWNPVTGCSPVSAGCSHCYAKRLAERLQKMGNPRYAKGFGVTLHEDLLGLPLCWRQPKTIFVNSMSDLFHEEVPEDFILSVFRTMVEAGQHIFQVLTKRHNRLAVLAPQLPWTDNIWLGVTVENADSMDRIERLRSVPAAVRFLSLEPLLSALPAFDMTGIDWVIVGGESGPGARPMHPEWVTDLRDRCLDAGVPFFFKQWGGVRRTTAGRELDGRTWDELPRTSARY